ncbi:hypothetical protein PR202_gb07630 [Eleusine coracana subsp. coracana]|uniref:Uncharacterized protein n=1 Tax=Eleusine coracana subsp. coracana TaxID=191504 RepID=A0AAV5EDF6_ELECO|nr:hypothetical protein PR202_gb07630 [Eleusine coracana subsp. coracana]
MSGVTCSGTLWRRSKVISSRRRDQIAEDCAASATIAGARSLVERSEAVVVGAAQRRAAASDPAAIGDEEQEGLGGGSEKRRDGQEGFAFDRLVRWNRGREEGSDEMRSRVCAGCGASATR